jgi:nucleoside-diphosphate-sugar epimerase
MNEGSSTTPARTLVTGATGFIGRAVVGRLYREGVAVTAAGRNDSVSCAAVPFVRVIDLGSTTDWTVALAGCGAVVHCAARVHVMSDKSGDPLNAYRAANVEGTVTLAKQAAAAGVRRFVFISSIKVNGEATVPGLPYRATDRPAPVDPYGISKLEAEEALQALAATGAIELVIIRPPLVYGPGVKANFLSMARWIARGVPLPFGGLKANRRSFVALENMVDLIVTCLQHPAAVGQVFLVSDGEDLSTAELLRRTAKALDVPSRLIPVPAPLLALGARAIARQDLWHRLGGTLQVDATPTRERLGWMPPINVDEGLRAALAGLRNAVPHG